ncbi:MAG: winged helix-turn-helix transcriptional regulator [Candidatus Muiribacteriota bacterium]|jgi:SOS-response transcriptional repressor LexA
MNKLTVKQQEFLEKIVYFKKNNGYPPTISDLCSMLNVSIGTVQQYFFALEKKGIIKRENNKGRGLKLLVSLPETDGDYINIPVFSEKLNNNENILANENVTGWFRFPKILFKTTTLYALSLKNKIIFFSPQKKYKKADVCLFFNRKKFFSDVLTRGLNSINLGKVLYVLVKTD